MQVVTVGHFRGGGAFNVIPDSVTIGGTFRAFSREGMVQLRKRIEEVMLKLVNKARIIVHITPKCLYTCISSLYAFVIFKVMNCIPLFGKVKSV